MKILYSVLILLSYVTLSYSQKVSTSTLPVLKASPGIFVSQHTDKNYLIYGYFDYYSETLSGSLIKVNEKGELVSGFKKVNTDEPIRKLTVLASGKILIMGSFKYLNGKRVGPIALLNADGSPDTGFNADLGLKAFDFVVQSGKILVLTNNDPNSTIIKRLNTDGTYDNSFSTTIPNGYISKITVDNNNRVYIIEGFSKITRLSIDGATDNTFQFIPESGAVFVGFRVQPDNKLIISTDQIISLSPYTVSNVLKRINEDGTVDPSFSTTPSNDQVLNILIRKSGKIVISGLFTSYNSLPGGVIELNPDGSVNRSLLTTDYNLLNNVYEDVDENILVTGGFRKVRETIDASFIAKIKSDNSIDLSFKVPVSGAGGQEYSSPMAVQPDGKVLIGGGFNFIGAGDKNSKLFRFSSDGTIDPTFKPAISTETSNLLSPSVFAIGVQEDGKIILGGAKLFQNTSPALARLLPDGSVDESFKIGSGPAVSNGFVPNVRFIKMVGTKIYVFGYFDKFNNSDKTQFVILDKEGNVIGPEKSALPLNSSLQDIEIQSTGKVVLMGSFPIAPNDTRDFIRLNTDGSIDNTFHLTMSGNKADIAIDANDHILLTGSVLNLNVDNTLLRFTPDGDLDNTFNTAGKFDGLNAFFVHSLRENKIAITGFIKGFGDVSSPGLVILDQEGKMVPFENPFDSAAYPIITMYDKGILYLKGRLSKNKGQDISNLAKVYFPVTGILTNYKVKATTETTMSLTWEGNFTGANNITIERSVSDDLHYEIIDKLIPSAKSYEAKQLNEASTYYFRVTAKNEFYSSPSVQSKDTTFIFPQVVLPASEVTNRSFTANWNYLTGTDSVLLQVSKDNFATFVNGYEKRIVKSGSRAVTDLEEGSSYQYRVKRFKNHKTSGFSQPILVNVILGVEDEGLLNVNLSPNPAKDYLIITLPENFKYASGSIRAANGALLSEYPGIKNGERIDIQTIPSGFFIFTLKGETGSRQFKFIK